MPMTRSRPTRPAGPGGRGRPWWTGARLGALLGVLLGTTATVGQPTDMPFGDVDTDRLAVDTVLLDYQRTDAFRHAAASSVLSASARMPALDSRVEESALPVLHGSVAVVQWDGSWLALASTALVGAASAVRVRLPSGDVLTLPRWRADAETAGADEHELLAAFAFPSRPPGVVALTWSEVRTREGLPGLTLSGLPLAWLGDGIGLLRTDTLAAVVSKAHWLGRPRALKESGSDGSDGSDGSGNPLPSDEQWEQRGVWVSDLVQPYGSVLLDVDGRLMGMACALAPGTSGRTLAVDAPAIRRWLQGERPAGLAPTSLWATDSVSRPVAPLPKPE